MIIFFFFKSLVTIVTSQNVQIISWLYLLLSLLHPFFLVLVLLVLLLFLLLVLLLLVLLLLFLSDSGYKAWFIFLGSHMPYILFFSFYHLTCSYPHTSTCFLSSLPLPLPLHSLAPFSCASPSLHPSLCPPHPSSLPPAGYICRLQPKSGTMRVGNSILQ